MFGELLEFRGLIWRLIIRDLSARYKQSVFGILWAFITPLVMMLVFVSIRSKNILPIGETSIPYAAFVFTGQMAWLLFSQGITTSANSLVAAGNMLTKINFPREVLVFSAMGQTILYILPRMATQSPHRIKDSGEGVIVFDPLTKVENASKKFCRNLKNL